MLTQTDTFDTIKVAKRTLDDGTEWLELYAGDIVSQDWAGSRVHVGVFTVNPGFKVVQLNDLDYPGFVYLVSPKRNQPAHIFEAGVDDRQTFSPEYAASLGYGKLIGGTYVE